MILVLLGTQPQPFTRLIKEIDNLSKNNKIEDDIIVQLGNTKYEFTSNKIKSFDFTSSVEISKLIKDAKLVITHGGVGSIVASLKQEKRILVVPRLAKYNEHTNDHQLDITKYFLERKCIVALIDEEDFYKKYCKAIDFEPKKYITNNDKMINIIKDFIK